jgi:hypothetical protein
MTRFAISGDYLYVVGKSNLQVFSTTNDTFKLVGNTIVENGMETIFIQDTYLYLGATDAMYIYSIEEPVKPELVFRYSHITSCDPVVVQGNRAYVTLRTGTRCNGGTNSLEILDISDRFNPSLIANYTMNSPHGLGVEGNLLFLCDGSYGLKVYDLSMEKDIQLLTSIDTHHAYDVIAKNGILQVTGNDGLFQYSYTATGQLQLLSKIPVTSQ